MAELEMYLMLGHEGPCVDSARTGRTVFATGAQINERWPTTGGSVIAAGFQTVLSLPLMWRGEPVGGFNLFWQELMEPTSTDRETARAFADAVTLLLGRSSGVRGFRGSVVSALNGRVIIETAKGALSHGLGTDMSTAYDELRRRAHDEGRPLSETARVVLAEYDQHRPPA